MTGLAVVAAASVTDFQKAVESARFHVETLEPRLTTEYAGVIRAAGANAADRFRTHNADIRTLAEENVVAGYDKAPLWAVPALDDLIETVQVEQDLRTGTAATRTEAAVQATRPIMSAVGVSFSLESPMVRDLVARSGVRAAGIAIPGLRDYVFAAISQAFQEGLSVDQTADLILARTDELAGFQAQMLAQTDLIGTANGGSLLAAKAVYPEVGTLVKQWVNATNSNTENDGKIRPTHLEANGQQAQLDDAFTVGEDQLLYPGDPSGSDAEVINCFPAETLVRMPALRAVTRRWYEGDLIRVRFASGHTLSGTPNHPVLRADGTWSPLVHLHEGVELVSTGVRREMLGAPNPYDSVAEIGEVYRLAKIGGDSKRVGGSPPNFHGDGSVDHEVYVVSVDGSLLVDTEAASDEEVAQFGLSVANRARATAGGSDRSLTARWTDDLDVGGSARGVRSGGDQGATIVIERTHPDSIRLTPSTDIEADLTESQDDHSAADSERPTHGEDALLSGVTITQVVEIDRYSFHGYVYNLDTGDGWYEADSIITRNCRCSIVYSEATVTAANWDESKHPRETRGHREGGRFRSAAERAREAKAIRDSVELSQEGEPWYVPARGTDTPEMQALRDDFGAHPEKYFDGPGDGALEAINRVQGFDGLPEVVSAEELDRRIAGGSRELWRGMAGGEKYAEDVADMAELMDLPVPEVDLTSGPGRAKAFRHGDFYPGEGTWGNGTYTAGGDSGPSVALAYADQDSLVDATVPSMPRDDYAAIQPSVVRMALHPEARVANGPTIRREWASHMQTDETPNRGQVITRSPELGLDSDLGRYAAARGYDAIDLDDGTGFVVLLNRTAVAVQEASS